MKQPVASALLIESCASGHQRPTCWVHTSKARPSGASSSTILRISARPLVTGHLQVRAPIAHVVLMRY
jgi:hypothetical protein